jgi:hypothetical protein
VRPPTGQSGSLLIGCRSFDDHGFCPYDSISGHLPTADPKTILEDSMELLTAEMRARLPALYSQEHNQDPTVHCKFFTPDSNWTWLVTEGSAEDDDFLLFSYVIGLEEEWGYFVLSELESARGPLGVAIERDLYFQPGPFSKVVEPYRRERGH